MEAVRVKVEEGSQPKKARRVKVVTEGPDEMEGVREEHPSGGDEEEKATSEVPESEEEKPAPPKEDTTSPFVK